MNIKSVVTVLSVLITILFFFIYCPQVNSFDVDGLKSGMTRKEVKEILGILNFDHVRESEACITANDKPARSTYRFYNVCFNTDFREGFNRQNHIRFYPSLKV